MAVITPVSKLTLSAQQTPAACSGGGDVVDNSNGPVTIVIANGAGSPQTVTVASQLPTANVQQGAAKADMAVAVAAGKTAVIGPLDPAIWSNVSNQVALTYSAVVTLTISAFVPH